MRRTLALGLIWFCVAISVSAQTIVYIDDNNPATGTSNTFPWAQANGFTTLHVYNASQLAAGGVCPGATLTDIAVAPSSGTSGVYNAPQARLSVGHLAQSPPIAGGWESNLVSPTVIHDLTSGPYTFPWTLNTWTPLPGVAAAGFAWDGVTDIAIFYTSSAGVTGLFNARRTATNLRHAVPIFNATNQAPTSNGLFAMKVRLTFVGGGPAAWQVNQPEASFSLGGTPAASCAGPEIVTACVGQSITASLASTLVGNGWDVAFHLGTAVSASGGGITLPNGNIVNVNILDPTLTLLNGGAFPPFPGNFAVPVSFGVPLTLVAQMVVLDPLTLGGVRLSAANELHVISGGSANGPTTDDSSLTINLGTPPHCGPGSIPFFGVNYTQLHVISNGRVMFSGAAGNTSFTPTVASALTDQPFVGAWCDLNPAGVPVGTITITAPASDQIQVNYNAVVYFGSATTNTFSINFNATTGAITIQNLTGLGVGVANMFLGISAGNTGATNPGATPFAIGGPNVTGNGTTDMIYNFGVGGPGLAGGANNITFTPSGAGYTWTGS